jgi:hypothetical protein
MSGTTEWQRARRAVGGCTSCLADAAPGRSLCESHLARLRERRAAKRAPMARRVAPARRPARAPTRERVQWDSLGSDFGNVDAIEVKE